MAAESRAREIVQLSVITNTLDVDEYSTLYVIKTLTTQTVTVLTAVLVKMDSPEMVQQNLSN